uniref:Uncharacterized protein n=1 Tax=Panagrolaimus davidi TaxID=227884 RepID=A0A914PDR1_9BILA
MSQTIRQQLGKLKKRAEKIIDGYDVLTPKWNVTSISALKGMSMDADTCIKQFNAKYEKWETIVDTIQDDEERATEKEIFDSWKEDEDYVYVIQDLKSIIRDAAELTSVSTTTPLTPQTTTQSTTTQTTTTQTTTQATLKQTTTADVSKKMEEYELKAETRAHIQHETGSSYSSTSTAATIGPSNKGVCSFSNGNHVSGSYETYKTMDERFDQLRKKGRCFKCAVRNHSTVTCYAITTSSAAGEILVKLEIGEWMKQHENEYGKELFGNG